MRTVVGTAAILSPGSWDSVGAWARGCLAALVSVGCAGCRGCGGACGRWGREAKKPQRVSGVLFLICSGILSVKPYENVNNGDITYLLGTSGKLYLLYFGVRGVHIIGAIRNPVLKLNRS